MSKLIDKLLNFGIKIFEIWQSGKIGKIGAIFVSTGLALLVGGASYSIRFHYSDEQKNMAGAVTSSGSPDLVLYVLGILFLLIGASILYKTYLKQASSCVTIYYGNMLKQGDFKVPEYAMEKDDRINIDKRKLDPIDSYNKEEVIDDYKHRLRTFKNRTYHDEARKIYIASLGSIPYLFLLGTLIRNGHIQNEILDYNRDSDKWYRLDSIGDKLTHTLMYKDDAMTIDEKIDELCNSTSESVGIALSYTYQIDKSSLPSELRDNTIFLTHGLGFGNDRINNKQAQASLLNELSVYIDRLKSLNKEVNLFVSAQASFNVRLGKRYQDNTMGEIKVYNFNGSTRKYDWFISFNAGSVN